MKLFWVDTNFFLQCKIPEQIEWKDISGGEVVRVYIGRTVQKEIDAHKQSGNSRKAKRGRLATAFFRKILMSPNSFIRVVDDPKVDFFLAPPASFDSSLHEDLNLQIPDDYLIAEALHYKASNPDDEVFLLTHDTNPMVTAKHCGLPFIEIPEDWLLPPEPSSENKRIQSLEQRISDLESGSPKIYAEILDSDENVITSLETACSYYENLTEEQTSLLMLEVGSRFPLVEIDSSGVPAKPELQLAAIETSIAIMRKAQGMSYRPPSQEKIDAYKNVKYPKWLTEVECYFHEVVKKSNKNANAVEIAFSVRNDGNKPADNLLVNFQVVSGDIRLKAIDREPSDKSEEELYFPRPPSPPEGKWISAVDRLTSRSFFGAALGTNRIDSLSKYIGRDFSAFQPASRDPLGFYWEPKRPIYPCSKCGLTCEDFRHKTGPEIIPLLVVAPDFESEAEHFGVIKWQISARNLPDPVNGILKVKISTKRLDAKEIALNTIPLR